MKPKPRPISKLYLIYSSKISRIWRNIVRPFVNKPIA